MKKIFTIAIIAISFHALAQNKMPIPGIHHQTPYSLDIIDFKMSVEGFQTSGKNSKENLINVGIQQKSEQSSVIHLMDSAYRWQWDTISEEWKAEFRLIYLYDANNNQISSLTQKWNNTAWVNSFKETDTYDANNNLLTDLYQNWAGSAWVSTLKGVYIYDANNNCTSVTKQQFNINAWVNSYKQIYTYDASNNLISYVYQYGDGSTWVSQRLNTYTYDANNNLLSDLSQGWSGSALVSINHHIYTYDANNNLLSDLYQLWNGSSWVTTYNEIFTYDANNNRISILDQNWNNIAGLYGNVGYVNYSYDSNNNLISDLHQNWVDSAWVTQHKVTYTYDANNNRITELYQIWDYYGIRITQTYRFYYYFRNGSYGIHDFKAPNEIVSVYPNPATNKIAISTNNILPGEILINIFGVNGQIIKQARFQNQKQVEMDVSMLAKGIYLVKIQTKAGIETKKLVIE